MTVSSAEQPEESPYKIGDRVLHGKYGTGTVLSAAATSAVVEFDSGRHANLMVSFLAPSDKPKPKLKADNDNTPLTFISPADWHDLPVPEREWWLDGLVPMGQVTILNGDGGVGKSLLGEQLAAAGALQCETLGLRPMPGRTMYIGAEDDADEFHRRLADIVEVHQRQLSDLTDFRLLPLADRDALLSVPERDGTMKPTALWTQIAEESRAFSPKLIVLDTSADLFGGDEVKRAQVRQFIAMLRKLAIEIRCAILLLSHPSLTGMQSGTGSSGSTAWNNSARSRLYLTRAKDDDDLRILTTVKSNYGKVGSEIHMRWQDGAFVLDDGKPSMAAGILNRRADEKFREMLSAINRTGQRVAPTKGVNYAPSIMAVRPDAGAVSKKQLEAAMHRLLAANIIKVVWDGPPSKQRQRLIVSAEDFGPEEEAA